MDDILALKIVGAGAAGLAVGAGVMIMTIAKWGRKLLGLTDTVTDKTESVCPYASDHPTLMQFMGESKRDREDLRSFLESVNVKVEEGNMMGREMKGKLDLLLQGARVRWNGALDRADGKRE